MFLLPNEMFLQKGKTIKLTMGQAIDPNYYLILKLIQNGLK